MFPALLASPEHLRPTLLVKPLTDTLPVDSSGILILNDAQKQLPLLARPRRMGDARRTKRKISKLTGRTIPVWNQFRNVVPVRCLEVLTIDSMCQAVAMHHEEQVVRLIHLPVFAPRWRLALLDEFHQRLASLYRCKNLEFLLKSLTTHHRIALLDLADRKSD